MDRRTALIRPFAVLLFAASTSAAQACGYCVEDKIAATYDHAIVERALGHKHQVVFFHVEGEAGRHALEVAAAAAPGVDRGSVRVSADALTLAVAFDPQRTSLAALQSSIERKLASRKLSLMPLRVMDRLAELKSAAPR